MPSSESPGSEIECIVFSHVRRNVIQDRQPSNESRCVMLGGEKYAGPPWKPRFRTREPNYMVTLTADGVEKEGLN
jgi:hypothetical protein